VSNLMRNFGDGAKMVVDVKEGSDLATQNERPVAQFSDFRPLWPNWPTSSPEAPEPPLNS